VDGEHPVRAALVDEGQTVEHVVGAEPDELGRSRLHRWFQSLLKAGADLRPAAVGRDHQVVVVQVLQRDLGVETEPRAHRVGPLLQEREQGAP
jgi:hypothetical protein